MKHGRNPARRQAPSLIVGDGDHRHVGEFLQQRPVEGKVEPAVQRRHRGRSQTAREREMKEIGVKVRDVEVAGAAADFLELQHAIGQRVADLRQSKRLRNARDELGRRLEVSAREQSHLMTLPHQLLGQIGDDTLRPAVKLRRDALDQGRNLGNSHSGTPLGIFPRNCASASQVPFRQEISAGSPTGVAGEGTGRADISPRETIRFVAGAGRAERCSYCGRGPSSGQPSAVQRIGENWSLDAPNASPS